MSSGGKARHALAGLVIGVMVGGGLMAVTPAGAEVAQVATSWKKIWKKQLQPQADKRYYKRSTSDARYASKSALASFYTKAESDARYAAAGSAYSKAEIDAKLAPLVNSVAATAGGGQNLTLTPADQVARSVSLMPPANGTVIVSSSAYVLGSVAGHTRCSITTGTTLDSSALQIVSPDASDFQSISGTRGFAVTKGALFTVNLVCDESTSEASLGDSSLTAIFAPS